MAPIRLRHPKGVSTIQIPLDREDYTVQDLLQEIYKATEILPSRQSCAFQLSANEMILITYVLMNLSSEDGIPTAPFDARP